MNKESDKRHTDRKTGIEAGRYKDRQASRQKRLDRQADTQTDEQTDYQTGSIFKQTNRNIQLSWHPETDRHKEISVKDTVERSSDTAR
jgi:hypothetical protein